jgi:hypothetical protein
MLVRMNDGVGIKLGEPLLPWKEFLGHVKGAQERGEVPQPFMLRTHRYAVEVEA